MLFSLMIIVMLERTYAIGKIVLALKESFGEFGKFLVSFVSILIAFYLILRFSGRYLLKE